MAEVISNVGKKHTVKIQYRESIELTGVISVLSYDENCVTLKLSDNVLTLDGDKFNIETLDLQEGNVRIGGTVGAMRYAKGHEKVGFLKRVFR